MIPYIALVVGLAAATQLSYARAGKQLEHLAQGGDAPISEASLNEDLAPEPFPKATQEAVVTYRQVRSTEYCEIIKRWSYLPAVERKAAGVDKMASLRAEQASWFIRQQTPTAESDTAYSLSLRYAETLHNYLWAESGPTDFDEFCRGMIFEDVKAEAAHVSELEGKGQKVPEGQLPPVQSDSGSDEGGMIEGAKDAAEQSGLTPGDITKLDDTACSVSVAQFGNQSC